jgi:hypothetical protein
MRVTTRPAAAWLALLLAPAAAPAGGVPRAQCFPVEELPPDLRAKAERVLLDALDREALFTVVGGVKPVSEGFWTLKWDAGGGSPEAVDEARRVLATFRCGDALAADLLVFKAPPGKGRVAHAFVANAAALRAKVGEDPRFWLRLGVTASSHPSAVMTAVEHADPADRFRGFGYAFGYPRHAVDFFVAAAESEKKTGEFVKRDFVNLPTFAGEKGRFVWAVPKGHEENAADRAVRAAAAPVLEAYRQRRAHYVGEGKPGVVALLRDWFDDGTGRCDPANASLAPFVPPAPAAVPAVCVPYPVWVPPCPAPAPPRWRRSR